GDDHWSLELAIPFRNFSRDAAATPPRNGDRWRLNLNRTGGITNKQNSTWSPVPPPAPGFHTPEGFGWVRFVNQRRDSRSEEVAQIKHSAEDIIAGRVLYNRSCTGCHGLDGEAGDRAPALAGARRYLRRTDDDIYDAIKVGIPGTLMPPMGFADADTWKIVAYIRSLRATAFDDVLRGDVARGEKVFWGKAKCGDCHMLNGRGGLVGPDLSSIAAERTSGFLKESLTKRRPASRGYKSVKIALKAGGEISGVLKNEHNFSYQVLDRHGKLHLLTRDEVQTVTHGTESLMPSNFDKTLSPAELQDVLAFLSRQAASRVRQEQLGLEDLLR
ncbi:MAG: c-type cytochrome, partial [Bryobacteraceae bacterium]